MLENKKLWKITENLIILERDAEELLLVNAYELRPLFIRRGREYIKGFLEAAKRLGERERILEYFPEDAALMELLIEHHILIPADKEERDADLANLPNGKERPQGVSLYLLVAQSCNMACVYCLNGVQTYKKEQMVQMSEPVAFKAAEYFIDRILPGGQIEICLFGGEPMLNWKLGKKVISYCEETLKPKYPDKRISYGITTNLLLLPDDFIEVAQRYNIGVLCDVDGPAALHDELRPRVNGGASYEQIRGNIQRLVAAGIRVNLRTTVTSKNVAHIPEIARHHKELNSMGCAFVPVNPVNSDEQLLPIELLPNMDEMAQRIREAYHDGVWDGKELFPFSVYASKLVAGRRSTLGCGAPYGNTPVITAEGDVYPCIYLVGNSKFHLGNLMDGSYGKTEVLSSMAQAYHVDYRENCKDCNWRYICGGGCLVGPLTVMGRDDASEEVVQYCRDINCRYTKKVFEEIFWQMATETAARVDDGKPMPRNDEKDRMNYC